LSLSVTFAAAAIFPSLQQGAELVVEAAQGDNLLLDFPGLGPQRGL
jgi:hypothetical protein